MVGNSNQKMPSIFLKRISVITYCRDEENMNLRDLEHREVGINIIPKDFKGVCLLGPLNHHWKFLGILKVLEPICVV